MRSLANGLLFCFFLIIAAPSFCEEEKGSMVTRLEGRVEHIQGANRRPLEAFERLEPGALLTLDKAQITLVFFLTGRQETWHGSGRLELGPGEGKGFGPSLSETKVLPSFLVKQISRTPTLLAQGRAGVTRLRAISTPEAVDKVEETYRRLRVEAADDDLNPEIYRLSALYEMKAYAALESAVSSLESARPGNKEARQLASLYREVLRMAREAR